MLKCLFLRNIILYLNRVKSITILPEKKKKDFARQKEIFLNFEIWKNYFTYSLICFCLFPTASFNWHNWIFRSKFHILCILDQYIFYFLFFFSLYLFVIILSIGHLNTFTLLISFYYSTSFLLFSYWF